jgi:hypothetical protein
MAKYRNIKTNGYDSKKENARANELKLLERAGHITELCEQVVFQLQPAFKCNGKTERAIKYIADFTYQKDGKHIVEDVKSPITKKLSTYSMKRKMLLFKYPEITFIET